MPPKKEKNLRARSTGKGKRSPEGKAPQTPDSNQSSSNEEFSGKDLVGMCRDHFLERLSKQELQNLRKQKYTAGGYTPLDNVLNHYWKFVSNYIPSFVSPNMVTLLGLAVALIPVVLTLLEMKFDLDLAGGLPNELFLGAALAIFIYNTMDAIDGKHARNTNQSSPLGQMFDHGCDSVVLAFMIILLSIALAPPRPFVYGWAIPMYYAFFCGQWEEAHTGTMRTGIGYIGVTEGTFFCIAVLIARGVFGWELYQLSLRDADVATELNLPPAFTFVFDLTVGQLTSIVVSIVNVVIVLSFTRDVIIGKGKTEAIKDIIYPLALNTFGVLIALFDPLFGEHGSLALLQILSDVLCLHYLQMATLDWLYFYRGLFATPTSVVRRSFSLLRNVQSVHCSFL
eukprot:gb/GECG01015605.1/.p1 GENE.gb/GECG01015605.1/~~gb/GECG01015605.1/.p1  ORF type:complete len:397 (+),score=34.77 gb/GECG01015605.1/:1-1191(+)